MIECGAVLGGEGNGGIIDPYIHYTRDSFVGACRILEYIALSGNSISKLADSIPKYYMLKERLQITDCRLQITDFDFLVKLFPDGKINRDDGLRIKLDYGWLHIRKSNTEPIIRIICETKNKNLTKSLLSKALNGVKKCVA
jgi:phosphomannomutase